MSATVCDGHVESGEACDATCDPHREEMRRLREQQRRVYDIAYELHTQGREEDAQALYRVGEGLWDDAIHIASPLDGHLSLCGSRGRNLVPLDGPRPDGGSGCWGCLQRVDQLVAVVAEASS